MLNADKRLRKDFAQIGISISGEIPNIETQKRRLAELKAKENREFSQRKLANKRQLTGL